MSTTVLFADTEDVALPLLLRQGMMRMKRWLMNIRELLLTMRVLCMRLERRERFPDCPKLSIYRC
jgi:hypothetical protein